jgi:hypothetical protein
MISRAENPLGDGQMHQEPPTIDDKARPAPNQAIGQVNYFAENPDEPFRPLKVVRPV